jgi:hypothetical protein
MLENFRPTRFARLSKRCWTTGPRKLRSFLGAAETGTPYGRKNGNNTAKITRARELATRCVGMKGDLNLRSEKAVHPSTVRLLTCRRIRPSCTRAGLRE